MKTSLILMMAGFLSRRAPRDGFGFRQMFFPLVLVLLPAALIVGQPDLGTAMMVTLIGISMIIFVGVKLRIIVVALISVAILLPMAWSFGLKDYQRNRVLTFLDPNRDPRGAGYNSIQSKIAVGSGQFLGKGFRKGSQAQLEFLPEQHTDFIFSVLSEEWGFVGSITTISIYCFLIVRGLIIASQAREKSGALLAVGILGMIFWHMFINVGMVTGVLPIVGIPLPLISYGGSSMLTTMLGLGLISSVAYRRYLF
jgi:rod shape determining protein RodA